ncbi:Na+/H+-dicarboxylate symporter [Naumannella cuiyingiana]|uniref:Na+/H+-dicarboxylate symporter n=1 Tax=Naumannella cuiyingiana TaxID=1347891 RepID=A0A7Z0IM15_9ACTN|nr:dicarboxylate/amino acid:cation symporter [Naumannella cuiyingiana]NYI72259.1 Na+/H+-dicarboxylate symporter [Naumannella cuiyingiana]
MSLSSAPSQPRRRFRIPFWAQVLLGLLLGAALGLIARVWSVDWLTQTLSTIGSTFVQLLRVIVVPLILTAIIVSIANLRQVQNARLAIQTLIWFAITSLIAVAIGIGIGLLTNPGATATIPLDNAAEPSSTGSWLDFLESIIPANILGLEASSELDDGSVATSLSFNVLQLVVLGIVLGAAALAVGDRAKAFIDFNRSVLEITQKITWWVIKLAPIGSGALIGRAIAAYGWDLVAPLAVFTADVYIGCLIVLLIVYPVLIKAHGLSVRRFAAGVWPTTQFGFVSRSSVGTLPITRQSVRRLGVPDEYGSFAVPFGATTKMDGCAAIYPALAAITVAQLFGVPLDVTDYLLIAFVSVVGSAATAGLTGAIVMLSLTLSTLGLPLEGVGLLIAIDPILDMIRTATNVTGQALVPVIVAKRNGILDRDVYDGRRLLDDDPEAAEAPAAQAA